MSISKAMSTLKRAEELLVASAMAHRACCGTEHDPANGKLHGYCVVCGVPWPCDTAKSFMSDTVAEVKALREENISLRTTLSGRTYCHSDEAVNTELTSLQGVVEKVREKCQEAISFYAPPRHSPMNLVACLAKTILSLLPEVPK